MNAALASKRDQVTSEFRGIEYAGVVLQFRRLGLRLDLLRRSHLDDVLDDAESFRCAAIALAERYKVNLIWSARGYRCKAKCARNEIHISSKARRRRGIIFHEIAHIVAY